MSDVKVGVPVRKEGMSDGYVGVSDVKMRLIDMVSEMV